MKSPPVPAKKQEASDTTEKKDNLDTSQKKPPAPAKSNTSKLIDEKDKRIAELKLKLESARAAS